MPPTPLTLSTRSQPASTPGALDRIARILIGGVLVGLIAACGNGGGGGDGGGNPGGGGGGGPGQSGRLEFFQASLHAVDPSDPETILTIDANASELGGGENDVGAVAFFGGTLQGGGVSDLAVEFVVYARADGTLQRVSTDATNGVPVPQRLSSETNALPLCDVRVGFDLADADNARFVYGSDRTVAGDCSGALTWRAVTLSDDAATDPVDFPGEPIEALFDPIDGSHTGWLAQSGGVLQRLAPDLSVQADNLFDVQSGAESLGFVGNGSVFLEIDNGLFAFDPATDTLIDFLFTFAQLCPCSLTFSTDQDFAYFLDSDELVRADATTANVASLDAPMDVLGFTPGFLSFVAVGTNHVAWSYLSDADGNPVTVDDQAVIVRSVAKDGSGAVDLDVLSSSIGPLAFFSTFLSANGGEWVFYDSQIELSPSLFQPVSVAARLDGTNLLRFPESLWIGSSFSTEFLGSQMGITDRIIRLDGVADLANLGAGTLSLSSFDASDPTAPPTDLGMLPSDTEFVFFLPGFGPARIGFMVSIDGFGNGQSDILFIDTETLNSLRRLTDTDGISEFPAPGF